MKLVGASWAFIRWPFIRRALFEGLLSAVVADGILAGGLYALYMFEPQIALIVDWKVAAVTAGSVLLLGLFITTFCSYLSVNKFLRMKAGDLYKV
jgi:cell division transport system permease protein